MQRPARHLAMDFARAVRAGRVLLESSRAGSAPLPVCGRTEGQSFVHSAIFSRIAAACGQSGWYLRKLSRSAAAARVSRRRRWISARNNCGCEKCAGSISSAFRNYFSASSGAPDSKYVIPSCALASASFGRARTAFTL